MRPVAISSAKAPVPQAIAPKRRRSFTGEPRPADKPRAGAAAEGARRHPAAQPQQPAQPTRRRRTHTDEDVHSRQTTPAAEKLASIWDDLDEDTRVINGGSKPGGDEIDQALARLRGAPAPVASPPAQPVARMEARPASAIMLPPAAEEPQDNPFAVPEPTMVMRRHGSSIHDELTSDGSRMDAPSISATAPGFRGGYGDVAGGPATERPPSMIDAGPAAPKRLDTLPALRVAVLATSVVGEVRLISLDAGDEPPPGAALAVLVPLSGADGEALARLFGATE